MGEVAGSNPVIPTKVCDSAIEPEILPTGENKGQQVECLDFVAIDASPGQDSVSGQHAVH